MSTQKRSGRLSLMFQKITDGAWTDMAGPLRCRVTYLRGGEEVMAGRLAGINTCVVRARASAVVDADHSWRIKDKVTSQIYDIKSLMITSDRKHADFTCQTELPK